mgnify:CR=1 FL=1
MDIYEEVTCRIVEQMEQGEIPWHKPWIAGGSCVSYATGTVQPFESDASWTARRISDLQAMPAGGRAHPQGREGAYGRVLEVD